MRVCRCGGDSFIRHRRRSALYIVAPQADQELCTPIFESLVNAVVRVIERRSAPTGLPIDPPLLLMLDEAANCAPLRCSTVSSFSDPSVVFRDRIEVRVRDGSMQL